MSVLHRLSSLFKHLRAASRRPRTGSRRCSPRRSRRPAGGGATTRPSSSATTARGCTPPSTPSPRRSPGSGRSCTANTGQAEHDQSRCRTPTRLPTARPAEPVADPVGAVVSHDRISRTHRQRFWYVAPQRSATRGSARRAKSGSSRRRGCGSSRTAREFVKAYQVAAPGVPAETFGPDEIIHLKYPNPLDPHYGLSPLQANALTVDANTELLKSALPDVPGRPAAGHGAANRADAHRPDGDAARREDRGEVRRPRQLAPAAGARTGAEGQPVDADAGGDGLPQLVADDARRNPRGVPGAAADHRASWRTWASARTSGSAPG